MSALLLVLPQIWATAADNRPLARAVHILTRREPVREPAQPFVPGRRPPQRKAPHSLRLVRAQALEQVQAPAPRALPLRPQPQLAIYRKYTEAMLRRYLKLSMEAGRVPSLLGQDMFRGNVSHCAISGFDDSVIFVQDVNKCLAELDACARYLVRKIAIEGYTQGETAAMRGLPLRSVIRRYTEGIDRLTRLFLDRRLLQEMGDPDPES